MSITEKDQTSSQIDDGTIEIRLSDIVTFLKKSRRFMLIGSCLGAMIGALYAFSLPNQYTSQITVLPELQNKTSANLSNLSSLAGLAGIDVNNMPGGSDAIRPELYPNVIQSIPFALSLFRKPVYTKGAKQAQSFESFWQQHQKPGLLNWLPLGRNDDSDSLLTRAAHTNGALQITKAQEAMARDLKEYVSASYDKKSGVLIISSTMPDPLVSSSVAGLSLDYLTDYVTTYRTEKARREVDFLAQQVVAAKQRYQRAEYELSAYRDKNRSVFLNTAKIEEQRIQAEFLLAQDLYNTLSKQAEMAKIKVQEETPVFKILEPAQVPLRKSGPKRLYIILGLVTLGLFTGLASQLIGSFLRGNAMLGSRS
ncbi:Wzz/FepE/Etk N-terminal domain-containing protein [Fibrella arboris]|uniref:Wzz/FepE/Etk N-terminal domain-containing protein n=1 Tax=Fibrella arboris TaxID=3242486 RepID=UPI0035207CE4